MQAASALSRLRSGRWTAGVIALLCAALFSLSVSPVSAAPACENPVGKVKGFRSVQVPASECGLAGEACSCCLAKGESAPVPVDLLSGGAAGVKVPAALASSSFSFPALLASAWGNDRRAGAISAPTWRSSHPAFLVSDGTAARAFLGSWVI